MKGRNIDLADKKFAWKTIEKKLVYDSPWCKVRQDTVELPNGTIIDD